MSSRDTGLAKGIGDTDFLNHDILFERTGKVLNISNSEIQQAITQRCVDTGVKVPWR